MNCTRNKEANFELYNIANRCHINIILNHLKVNLN